MSNTQRILPNLDSNVVELETRSIPEGAVKAPNDVVDAMFETAFDETPNTQFLNDIYEWWEKKGFLTSVQYAALQRRCGED